MKEKRSGKGPVRGGTDWDALRERGDERIRRGLEADPEAQATDAGFWKAARVVMPRPKMTVTIRLDADLLEWLRQEKGYQTRINAVLRAYMEACGARKKRS